ncbi:MAG: hypothetical protein ACK4GT_13470 [Pararhodobacter sp.]
MKTELTLSPDADMVAQNVVRPAMVNEVTAPMPAARRVEAVAAPVRLHLLARRQQRWDRRAARA